MKGMIETNGGFAWVAYSVILLSKAEEHGQCTARNVMLKKHIKYNEACHFQGEENNVHAHFFQYALTERRQAAHFRKCTV